MNTEPTDLLERAIVGMTPRERIAYLRGASADALASMRDAIHQLSLLREAITLVDQLASPADYAKGQ